MTSLVIGTKRRITAFVVFILAIAAIIYFVSYRAREREKNGRILFNEVIKYSKQLERKVRNENRYRSIYIRPSIRKTYPINFFPEIEIQITGDIYDIKDKADMLEMVKRNLDNNINYEIEERIKRSTRAYNMLDRQEKIKVWIQVSSGTDIAK
jgi:hypothetical protein